MGLLRLRVPLRTSAADQGRAMISHRMDGISFRPIKPACGMTRDYIRLQPLATPKGIRRPAFGFFRGKSIFPAPSTALSTMATDATVIQALSRDRLPFLACPAPAARPLVIPVQGRHDSVVLGLLSDPPRHGRIKPDHDDRTRWAPVPLSLFWSACSGLGQVQPGVGSGGARMPWGLFGSCSRSYQPLS
jgi:hypothetical protein